MNIVNFDIYMQIIDVSGVDSLYVQTTALALGRHVSLIFAHPSKGRHTASKPVHILLQIINSMPRRRVNTRNERDEVKLWSPRFVNGDSKVIHSSNAHAS